jgi:hypothetical protein
MRRCDLFRSLAAAAVCLLLASCIDSKNPAGSPEKSQIDPELVGVWRSKSAGRHVGYYHLARAAGKLPAGVMRLVSITYNTNGALQRPGDLLAFTAGADGGKYLNIALTEGNQTDQLANEGWKPELVQNYFVVKYRVSGNALSVWPMDRDAKRRLIEAGKIKGKIERNAVYFTDTSERLAALLAGPEAAGLFAKEPVCYERVK